MSILGALADTAAAITRPMSQFAAAAADPAASTPSSSGAAPAASTTGSGGTAATITDAQNSLVSDQQTFLKLLTTQLKNQDPLSPMDTNQFTQQLVAMTGVQQQIVTNQLLQQLVNGQSGMGDPVSLIGKTVTASTDQSTLQGGAANWLYSTDANAQDVQLQVVDNLGRVVWQSDAGAVGAGEHALSWNGKDGSGLQRPDGGTYVLRVQAADASGAQVGAHVYQRGLVSQVIHQNGQTSLLLNGVSVPASAVTSVGAAA